MNIVPSDEDWACFTDGDFAFLKSDFGHHIKEVVDAHKNDTVGLITCLTNRVGKKIQCYNGEMSDVSDIREHRKIADLLDTTKRGKVTLLNQKISAFMMCVNKKAWKDCGGFVDNGNMLNVDNQFSFRIKCAGWKILRMDGLYGFHYYRLHSSPKDISHLKPKK